MNSNIENSKLLDEITQQLRTGHELPEELLEIFGQESEDHLLVIESGLSRLQACRSDLGPLSEIRRATHTLKGAAGAVNQQVVTQLSHRMEDLLDELVEKGQPVTESQAVLLQTTSDLLQELTNGEYEIDDAAVRTCQLLESYNEFVGAKPGGEVVPVSGQHETPLSAAAESANLGKSSSTTGPHLRVPLSRLDKLVGGLGEMVVAQSEFHHRLHDLESRLEELENTLSRLRTVGDFVDNQARTPGTNHSGHKRLSTDNGLVSMNQDAADPLEIERYDDLQRAVLTLNEADHDSEIMVGELRRIHSEFKSLIRRQQRLIRESQYNLMKVRMVPLAGTCRQLKRAVRTVSTKLQKKVDFQVTGETIELDKTVMDQISDPLLHLVRNAIDHGIESPAERESQGKPSTAQLKLSAVNHGTQVTLQIADDGRGIDTERVFQKAVERGLVSADQDLSRDEVHALIFQAGFSTAAELTDVSGRGVGLDVVQETIRRLKGLIRVESQPGQGTIFTIQLPTTIAVSRAVLVESAGHQFAIPSQSIQHVQRLDPESVRRSDGQVTTRWGNSEVRLIDLADHLHLKSDSEADFELATPVLRIGTGEYEIAVTVDSVIGSRDIVVKTLGSHLQQVRGMLGATLGGDGNVIPILDTLDLVCPSPVATSIVESACRGQHDPPESHVAMVVDDSISVRRVTANLLSRHGWHVVTARDGVDALEQLGDLNQAPELFLCDMEMPRMNGLELIRQLRELPDFEQTPILMVTSRSSEKHRHKAFEAGATEYVVKPYNDESLLQLIEQLVACHRETV